MKPERIRTLVRNTLLAFVLVSIGFAMGKASESRRQVPTAEPAASAGEAGGDKVVVYSLHASVRCVTCNEIGRLARTLMETEFADDLAAGRIDWREVNFQQDEAFAKRYDVVASGVMIADVRGGETKAFRHLDDVWSLHPHPAEFNAYVGKAIRAYLAGGAP